MVTDRPAPRLDDLLAALTAGRLSRRGFLARAAGLGLMASLASSLAAAAASHPGGVSASLQGATKTLVVAIPQATDSLDPALAGASGYGDIVPITDNLTEGLTRIKPGTTEVEPALAVKWDVSADGLTYVCHLRPNVTFHDGTPFDAKAVEFNFQRQLDPKNPYHYEGITYAEIVFAEVATVKATGALDLTITLKRPIILVPQNLALFAAGIISPTALQKYGKDFSQHAAGTGPFKLDHWTKDVELVYVANDSYWGGRPALDRVVWRTIPDDTVRLSELKAGSIDVGNQIDFKDVSTLKSDPNLQAIAGNFLNVQFVGLNRTVPPFDNLKIRQAIQYAINKSNISDAVFYGNYKLGAGPIAPGLVGYDESLANAYPYNPDQAKALLKETNANNLSFDLYNRSNSFWPLIGQLIQADLDAIGIKANLKSLQDADFFSVLNAGKAGAFINDWTWDNTDSDNVMYGLFSAPRAKRIGYPNPQVDPLILQAQVEKDQTKRAQLYQQAQKLIMDDAVMVVLGYPGRVIGAKKSVQNLVVSPVGTIVLRQVSLA